MTQEVQPLAWQKRTNLEEHQQFFAKINEIIGNLAPTVDEAEQAIAQAGHITYGSNVKEVTTQVREGSADCGVIYATDAFSAKLKPVDKATKAMCGQVIYPAAVMKNSKHPQEAQAFLDYLKGQEAMKVFQRVGFSPVG